MTLPTPESLLRLYRAARAYRVDEFALHAFAWMGGHVRFDSGSLITSLPHRPAFADAHFHGIPDPRALLESWREVSHLDELSAQVVAQPSTVHHRDADDPRIAADRFAPLRRHLERFALWHSLFVALPVPDGESSTVLVLTRATRGDRFDEREVELVGAIAPHVAEALAVSRGATLLGHPALAIAETALALVDAEGRIAQCTRAFTRHLWASRAPDTPHLPAECVAALASGRTWCLPDGAHLLDALDDGRGGFLVCVRAISKLDRLTARERQIALSYAEGQSHSRIAADLGIAPATVRNHIRHAYGKLEIRHRVELVAIVREHTAKDASKVPPRQ